MKGKEKREREKKRKKEREGVGGRGPMLKPIRNNWISNWSSWKQVDWEETYFLLKPDWGSYFNIPLHSSHPPPQTSPPHIWLPLPPPIISSSLPALLYWKQTKLRKKNPERTQTPSSVSPHHARTRTQQEAPTLSRSLNLAEHQSNHYRQIMEVLWS